MTIHPARRKPHGEQPSASHDHTGTTKAWPPHIATTGSRTNDEKQRPPPPFTKSGKGTRTCVQTSKPDAPHRIEYQTELR